VRPLYKSIFVFYCLILLQACGNAAGAKRPVRSAGEDTTFLVSSIEPSSGSKSSVPTGITVNFTEIPNRNLLAVQTHYSMQCGADIVHAASVDATTGYSSVVATFDPITVSAGTTCTFTIASNVQSESGARLGGDRSAVYTIP
jgi:hypothetical protein